MSTHSIHFLDRLSKSSKTSLNICFLELKSFLETQKRVRISQGKRAFGVAGRLCFVIVSLPVYLCLYCSSNQVIKVVSVF